MPDLTPEEQQELLETIEQTCITSLTTSDEIIELIKHWGHWTRYGMTIDKLTQLVNTYTPIPDENHP